MDVAPTDPRILTKPRDALSGGTLKSLLSMSFPLQKGKKTSDSGFPAIDNPDGLPGRTERSDHYYWYHFIIENHFVIGNRILPRDFSIFGRSLPRDFLIFGGRNILKNIEPIKKKVFNFFWKNGSCLVFFFICNFPVYFPRKKNATPPSKDPPS